MFPKPKTKQNKKQKKHFKSTDSRITMNLNHKIHEENDRVS